MLQIVSKIVSKCYICCVNFYIMFVLLSNIFILYQINIIIWVDHLGNVLNLTQFFQLCIMIRPHKLLFTDFIIRHNLQFINSFIVLWDTLLS